MLGSEEGGPVLQGEVVRFGPQQLEQLYAIAGAPTEEQRIQFGKYRQAEITAGRMPPPFDYKDNPNDVTEVDPFLFAEPLGTFAGYFHDLYGDSGAKLSAEERREAMTRLNEIGADMLAAGLEPTEKQKLPNDKNSITSGA